MTQSDDKARSGAVRTAPRSMTGRSSGGRKATFSVIRATPAGPRDAAAKGTDLPTGAPRANGPPLVIPPNKWPERLFPGVFVSDGEPRALWWGTEMAGARRGSPGAPCRGHHPRTRAGYAAC